LLRRYLTQEGFEVLLAEDSKTLNRVLTRDTIDLIVLDLMLPGEDGLALLRWLRQRPEHRHLPVVMLTARGDTASRVVGLELGADDYLPKPFEPRELVARLQAVLRRQARDPQALPSDARRLQFAGWQFDRVARALVSPDAVTLPLSSAEFRLLSAFAERPGRVLSREQLLDLTRAPGVEVNDRSIDLAVSRLRTKLGDSPRDPRLIRTIRGEGYLFDTQVQA
jgi:two-component system OmpR family response regulator